MKINGMWKLPKVLFNGRFGASGAIPRPKGSADFQVLCFVSSAVKAPPAAKPPARYRQVGEQCSEKH